MPHSSFPLLWPALQPSLPSGHVTGIAQGKRVHEREDADSVARYKPNEGVRFDHTRSGISEENKQTPLMKIDRVLLEKSADIRAWGAQLLAQATGGRYT